MATIIGNARNNRLVGTPQNDDLYGLNGNDQLVGLDGDDNLEGGKNKDFLDGGHGNDILIGGSGNDQLMGGTGTDCLDGGSGKDWLSGGMGNDILSGGDGNDILQGSSALSDGELDTLVGGAGADTFVLGGYFGILYGRTSPTADIGSYALIKDFNPDEDVIQLGGAVSHYILKDAPSELPSGTAIYRDRPGDQPDELVGIVEGKTNLDLNNPYFRFQSLPAISLNQVNQGMGGFVINSEAEFDPYDYSVSDAGDVNGDGLDDLIVGAFRVDPSDSVFGKSYVVIGESYVVFGKTDSNPVNLNQVALGNDRFVINGEAADDNSGYSVSSAGDVNGDGLDDVIVGAYGALPKGKSYVVFGKTDSNPVNLDQVALGSGGFVIDGEATGGYSGASVSGAGDVNGDGLDDLIVGAPIGGPIGDPNGHSFGKSYVVFGKADGSAVSLSQIAAGSGGFVINGEVAFGYSGLSVSSAGDVNGDGLKDVIIGAPHVDVNENSSGRSYVVFGKTDGNFVNLNQVAAGIGGFAINGETTNNRSGYSVSGAGDVNGDGLDDLIVGMHDFSRGEGVFSKSYVVFGKTDGNFVNLNQVAAGIGGFAINSEAADDGSGTSVSGAGDVNGDGLDDMIVGAPYGANWMGSTKSYLVFGKADSNAINLSEVAAGIGGFSINSDVGSFDISVSGAGDVNGDGFADLLMRMPDEEPDGTVYSKSYVIYGGDFTQSVTQQGQAGDDRLKGSALADNLIGGLGHDILIGNGGRDVLYGGSGDDVIAIRDTNFTRISGGTGNDTLRIDGKGVTLDLTKIANNRINGIEQINLTGTGKNSLMFSRLEMLALSDESNRLMVRGNAGDTIVSLGQGWVMSGSTSLGNNIFVQYTAQGATLLVDADINRVIS